MVCSVAVGNYVANAIIENAKPAHADSQCERVGKLAFSIFLIIALATAGITLTVLGVITPNPIFFETGVILLFCAVLTTISLLMTSFFEKRE